MTGRQAGTVGALARLPEGLELSRPHADCAAVLAIDSAAYGMDLDAGQSRLADQTFWKGHFPVA